MKIQLVVKNTKFTGGRQEMFRHANELARRGHDVAIWVTGTPQLDWMPMQVPVQRLRRRSFRDLPPADICLFERPRFARPLWRARRGIPVHFCQGFEGTDVENRIAAIRARRGLVRGLPELWNLWRRRRQIDQGYATPTVKIVLHHHLRELIARRYGQAAYFVPYGLPEGVFTPPGRRDFHGQTVLVVGPTDTGWKRIGDALEAVRLLKQTRPGVRLIRVAQHEMRACERALHVTDVYHTMVRPSAMADLYRAADVLVLASDATEGFGLPLLEAMACGTPAVVTDIPAFRTFAQPADFAHFVPVANPPALAAALARVLDDLPQRQRLSKRGPQVASTYQMARSRQALENALLDIVAQARPAHGVARPPAVDLLVPNLWRGLRLPMPRVASPSRSATQNVAEYVPTQSVGTSGD
jgi:glycosyltransferase involved in cell wall biosynthesis